MPTIALLASPGKLLGFLLIAGQGRLQDVATDSDCILTGVPGEPALYAHELCAVIQSNKNREIRCRIGVINGEFAIDVMLAPDLQLHLAVPEQGLGEWHVMQEGRSSSKGVCELTGRH